MAVDQQRIAQPFDFASDQIHTKQRGLWSQAFSRLVRNRLAIAAAALLLVIVAVSVLGDVLQVVRRHDTDIQDYSVIEQNVSWNHWLGTDGLGRDLWARMLDATLFSLKIGLGAQFLILVVGALVGMAAALGGRWTDGILMWITDLAFAFPDLLMIILLRQVLLGREWPVIGEGSWPGWVFFLPDTVPGFPPTLLLTIVAISFVSWVTVARLIRGQMLSIKEQDYILAARAVGASNWRVVRSHMLPNTLSAVIVAVTFGIPLAIFAEAALGFVGLGVAPPAASLGSLINDGRDHLRSQPLEIVWPAIMIATLMLCFTFLGDGLRDALDPRTRK